MRAGEGSALVYLDEKKEVRCKSLLEKRIREGEGRRIRMANVGEGRKRLNLLLYLFRGDEQITCAHFWGIATTN